MVIHTNNNAYPQRGAWDSCRYCIMQQCKTTVQYGCILLLLFSNSKLDNNLYSTMVRTFCRQGYWQG